MIIFHPTQWFFSKALCKLLARRRPMFRPEIFNPPTWIEKQINYAKIDREYESSVKAEAPIENVSWVDKYNNDFEVTN